MKKTDVKGDLYLVIEILFPEDGFFTDPETLASLNKLLPPPPEPIEADETDEVTFEVADIDDIGGDEAPNQWEDEDGPQQAQCQTQ